jgi:hypothetical protein
VRIPSTAFSVKSVKPEEVCPFTANAHQLCQTAHLDHPDLQDLLANQANPEDQVNPETMAPQVKLLLHAHHKIPAANRAPLDHLDHPAPMDLQDHPDQTASQEAQDKEEAKDHQDQQDPPEMPELQDNQEAQDNQDKCTMRPEERDPPDHPVPTDNPAAQDSQEAMDNPVNPAHQDHPETMAPQEDLDSQEEMDNPAAMARREDMALATTAHPHALLQDIKSEWFAEEVLPTDRNPLKKQDPLPQISIDSTNHILTSILCILLSFIFSSEHP